MARLSPYCLHPITNQIVAGMYDVPQPGWLPIMMEHVNKILPPIEVLISVGMAKVPADKCYNCWQPKVDFDRHLCKTCNDKLVITKELAKIVVLYMTTSNYIEIMPMAEFVEKMGYEWDKDKTKEPVAA